MPTTRVALSAIIDGIECQTDESTSFLNRTTGEVVTITDDEFSAAESGDEPDSLSDWDEEMLAVARAATESEEYLPLPTRYDVDEYRIMERFAHGLENDQVRFSLLDTLRGRGAFRRFKDMSRALGVIDEWYRYRDAALEEIAIEWCQDHGIEFTRTAAVGAPET